jgi:hypothetical protein
MAVEHGPDFVGQPHHEFTILTASFLPSRRGRALPSVQGVIVHCKANQGKTVIQAIDFVLKEEKKKR